MRKGLLLCLLVTFAQGAETIGWRVPLDWVIPPYAREGTAEVLEAPPGESAFFEEGDQLVDVMPALNKVLPDLMAPLFDPFHLSEQSKGPKFEGKWVVWNKRSGMLVARGEWKDVGLIQDYVLGKEMPTMIRTAVEVQSTVDQVGASYVVLGRSGEKASRTIDEASLVLETHASRGFHVIDMKLDLKHPITKERLLELNTAVSAVNGQRMKIGSWRDSTDSIWEIAVVATPVTLDGTPIDDVLWTEGKGGVERVNRDLDLLEKGLVDVVLPDGLIVRRFNVAPDFVERLDGDHGHDIDPFAGPDEPRKAPFEFVEVPVELRGLGLDGLQNVSQLLKPQGIKFDHRLAMAGFSKSKSMVVMVNTVIDQELMEQITAGGGCCSSSHIFTQVEWGGGEIGVTSRSGEVAKLQVLHEDVAESSFETAANIGASGDLLEVTYYLSPKEGVSWNGALPLLDGNRIDLGSHEVAGEKSAPTIKAQVFYGSEVGD